MFWINFQAENRVFSVRIMWALLGLVLIGSGTGLAQPVVPNHAVVLIYHHISSKTPDATSLSPGLFGEHLKYLADNGHQVRGLLDIVETLGRGDHLPDLTVGLTFDDGYESVYSEAFPLLKARGWPFTVFVCAEAIDQGLGTFLSWDQLREMAAAGATVANHGLRHEHLQRRRAQESDNDWSERIKRELMAAQARIVAEIGTAPPLMAYPYGEYDPQLQAVVADLGWVAFGQQSGAVGPNSEFTRLPRFPMAGSHAALAHFGDKVRSVPLPVASVLPLTPLVDWPTDGQQVRPVLQITLQAGAEAGLRPTAFAAGQGQATLAWLDREAGVFEVRAEQSLRPGRSRYNITAPLGATDRYYWFSQIWIVDDKHRN